MGTQWLNRVKEILKQAGFRVEAGYPAHGAADLSDTVAAVNLAAMDEKSVREILVTVLTPRKEGLPQCQSRAERAVSALAEDGNRWSFSGWRYEAGIDCWAIEIHGSPALNALVGFTVAIGEELQENVTDFLAQQVMDRRMIYPHGQGTPSAVTPGKKGWILKLTQLFSGEEPMRQMNEPFQLTVCRGKVRQTYTGCCWQSCASRQKPEGIETVCSIYALDREVSAVEQNAV